MAQAQGAQDREHHFFVQLKGQEKLKLARSYAINVEKKTSDFKFKTSNTNVRASIVLRIPFHMDITPNEILYLSSN